MAKLRQGVNDLQTKYPKLAAEWDYEKNGDLKPSEVTTGMFRKVWWIGSCGHNWEAAIAHRVRGCRCPYCAGAKVLAGFNDLKTRKPEIAAQWNTEKNEGLTPEQFTAYSGVVVWWKCDKGHEWKAPIETRSTGGGCPVCKTIKGKK